MSKLPNNNGLLLFNKTVKEVKLEFKRQGRPEKWSEIQKWTSKKVFQKIKHKSVNKITLKDINKVVLNEIEKETPTDTDCDSVTLVPITDRNPEWWDIYSHISSLPPNVSIRINCGSMGKTKIDKVSNFSESDVTSVSFSADVRKFTNNSSGFFFNGFDKVKPNKKDDGKNCSYFIDFILADSSGNLVDSSEPVFLGEVSEEAFGEDRAKRFKESEKRKKENAKIQKRKKADRPKDVKKEKPKTEEKPKESKDRNDIVRALELLREDFKDGIFTKDEYKKERALLISKLEDGGKI